MLKNVIYAGNDSFCRDEANRGPTLPRVAQAVAVVWVPRRADRSITGGAGSRPTTKGVPVRVFNDLSEFVAAAGSQLGPTEWMPITQERVNQFAEATDDHQWIHIDPERAASGPFGGTIAHGLLTLSLLPHFTHQMYRVDNVKLAVNYGYNKVRFITPVKVGANVRARAEISNVDQLDGAVQATMRVTVEIEGSDKPAAVVESIVRFIG